MRQMVMLGALIAAAATQAGAAAADLSHYVGKYPFDKIGGRSIYQAASIKAQFAKAFGEQRWRTVQSYGTATPIEAARDPALGRVLVIGQCKPHDCPNSATVLVTVSGNLIGACFVTFAGQSGSVEWLGPGWHKSAPTKKLDACGSKASDTLANFKSAAARH